MDQFQVASALRFKVISPIRLRRSQRWRSLRPLYVEHDKAEPLPIFTPSGTARAEIEFQDNDFRNSFRQYGAAWTTAIEGRRLRSECLAGKMIAIQNDDRLRLCEEQF